MHGLLSASTVNENEDGEAESDDEVWATGQVPTLFSNTKSLELPAEVCEAQAQADAGTGRLATEVAVAGGGGGSGGGRICHGGGGGSAGGDDDGDGSGYWDSYNGHDSTDVYYQKMIEANPNNPLLLSNYATYLKEVYT